MVKKLDTSLQKEQVNRGKIFALFSLFGLAIISIVPAFFFGMLDQSKLSKRINDINQISLEIIYFDEALTNSARLYTYTNNPEWLTRYDDYAARLDQALLKAQGLSVLIYRTIKDTADVNNQLIEIEMQAINLAKEQKKAEAQELLFSRHYLQLKNKYSLLVNEALSSASSAENDRVIQENKAMMQTLAWTFVLLSIAFVATLIYLSRFFKSTDRSLHALMTSLQEKVSELKQANKHKDTFLANMSHEIRTPLNGIYGSLQLLKSKKLDSESSELLNTAQGSVKVLSVIVNDILDVSKIEANSLELESIELNLQKILEDLNNLFRLDCEKKQITLSVELNVISPWRLGDAVRIKQILMNLLTNAIKFTDQGNVSFSVEQVDDSNDIRFIVADTGIGMDEDGIKSLFQQFKQADNSTTRIYGGTGLGMSIVQYLVKLMNGTISVDSEKGVGTRVEVILPLKVVTHKAEQVREKENVRFDRLKVLIAEDNKVNQAIITAMLKSLACQIVMTSDGQQACEKIDESYDLVLMDIHMPVLDGMQACRKIKQSFPNLPIVAVTASVLTGDVEMYYEIGFNDVVSKPIEKSRLISVLTKYS